MDVNTSNTLVYLVDDELPVRDALSMLIKMSGFAVSSYDSAEAFLNNFDPDQPGCLILDVTMPVMGGLELQEELVKRNINIPIIFISGNADILNSVKAIKAGAVDFLEKPFDNQIFLQRIDDALKKDILARKLRT
jgi:two-component system, LuxR family, response regulator FixJ